MDSRGLRGDMTTKVAIAHASPKVPPSQASTLMVQWSDGSWEDMHFGDYLEARAFIHAVNVYRRTGEGEEWYGDVFEISERPFLGSIN